MQLSTRALVLGSTVGLGAAFAAPALAADPGTMDVTINIPRLKVAEYHKPYVAVWVEKAGARAKTVAVWYDHDMKANEGTKWLRDVRQWWRVSGRSLALPDHDRASRAPRRAPCRCQSLRGTPRSAARTAGPPLGTSRIAHARAGTRTCRGNCRSTDPG